MHLLKLRRVNTLLEKKLLYTRIKHFSAQTVYSHVTKIEQRSISRDISAQGSIIKSCNHYYFFSPQTISKVVGAALD